MTEKFDYGKDNLASKYTYPSGKTATYSYDSILRRNRTVINTTTPIDHQYVYWIFLIIYFRISKHWTVC